MWGNPFKIQDYKCRKLVVAKYEEHLRNSPELLNSLWKLRGKRLCCFCVPDLCHGHVLLKVMKEANLP